MKLTLLLLLCAISCFGQWAENRHREEMTDSEVLTLHDTEKAERAAEDKAFDTRRDICRAHGEDEHHSCEVYSEGYVLITDNPESN